MPHARGGELRSSNDPTLDERFGNSIAQRAACRYPSRATMVLVTINKPKRLLMFTFAGRVEAAHLVQSHQDASVMIGELQSGFHLLADLTQLESMSLDCAPEIAKVMDLCARAGVKQIVRVIPDPAKDIGFTILTRFHYPNKPRAITCENLLEGAKYLDLL